MPIVPGRYTYTNIADYFIALSNETQTPITNMKLQKMVYYAQAWHLALLDRELIKEDFQAWVHGPVIPSLYGEYKVFGWKPIIREDLDEGCVNEISEKFQEDSLRVIKEVTYEYFGLTAYELEKLTHNEQPWKLTRDGIPDDTPSDKIIDKQLIADYYRQFAA